MVLQGIPHNEIGEKPEIALSIEDSLGSGKEKVASLKECVREIEGMTKEREKLSDEVFEEAEKVKVEIANFLANKDASNPDSIKERQGLRQKMVEIAELQLKEKVNCWQDVARLKQELREKKQDLTEKESRLNVLKGILK